MVPIIDLQRSIRIRKHSIHTPRHTSIDLIEARSSPPEASKDLPPSSPPQYEQLTIIGIGESSKVDEEAANTSLTPIPRQSWKSKTEIAVCLMVALLIFLGGALFFELSRRAHYAYPSKQGPRVSESM
jgi:hypothetical protein